MAGEFDLISKYFRPLAGPEGLDLADDAACVPRSGSDDIIVTKDMLIEGVHFRSQDPAESIGHKALAVNVSDCVAKGATPYLYWLGLALTDGADENWLERFSGGLKAAQQAFGCKLAGGDTTATSGPRTISITLLGTVPNGQMVKRSGANVGDDIYVTGTLGDAALGLWCLSNDIQEKFTLVSAYQKPIPPAMFGQGMRNLASSSADVSDGLLADSGHIAAASGVSMNLWQNKLPLSAGATQLLQNKPDLWPNVWAGGDDYQIVFTAPVPARGKLIQLADKSGIRISRIGQVSDGQGVQLLDPAGEIVQVASGGYTHF